MSFLSACQYFLKGWGGRNYKMSAAQEVSFSKTNRKFRLYQNQKIPWLIATNRKGQKQICKLFYFAGIAPQNILNSVYAHLNNLPKARSKEISENAPSSSSLQNRGLLTANLKKSSTSHIETTANWWIPQLSRSLALNKLLLSPTCPHGMGLFTCPWWVHNVAQMSTIPSKPHPNIRKPKQHSGTYAISPCLLNWSRLRSPLITTSPMPFTHRETFCGQ